MSLRSLLAALLSLTSIGCARNQIGVGVTTYLSRELPFPRPDPGRAIAVIAEADPDEPLLEAEVNRKVEVLLRGQGYSPAPRENAQYIMFVFFSIDSGTTEVGARPLYHPGGTAQTQVLTNTGQWATATTHLPGSTSYVPYSYTYFTRYLGVSLYEKDRWLAGAEKDSASGLVWRSTTVSSGASSDIRSLIDYLLVTTFEYFGRDTGRRVDRTLRRGNKDVAALRESARAPGVEP